MSNKIKISFSKDILDNDIDKGGNVSSHVSWGRLKPYIQDAIGSNTKPNKIKGVVVDEYGLKVILGYD